MIGGIYFIMDCGTNKEVTQNLLGKTTTIKIKEVDRKINLIIDAVSDLSSMSFPSNDISNYLFKIAKGSMSRRISASHRRDFKNETVDLMHSIGVSVQKGFGAGIDSRNIKKSPFNGGSQEVGSRRRRSDHPDPKSRFDTFSTTAIGTAIGGAGFQRNHWYIMFSVSMPYAVRLEHQRVPSFHGKQTGGYGKRVLIGQFHTLMNQFVRDSGMSVSGGGVKVQQYWYGYIFETNGRSEIIEQSSSGVSK